MAHEQINLNWPTFSDHLKDMIQKMLQSNEFADVTLVCDDNSIFKAHKFVLKACSPIFQSIINELPQKESSVIFLRGVLKEEMKSILQFIYLGQATSSQDRLLDFLNVAKSLKIKELCKDVNTDDHSVAVPVPEMKKQSDLNEPLQPNEDDEDSVEPIESPSKVSGDTIEDTKKSSYQNESAQYPCQKCEKKFSSKSGVYTHNKTVHEGMEYPCITCKKVFSTSNNLYKHIKSIHEAVMFPCGICSYEASRMDNLKAHKKSKHKVMSHKRRN